MFNVSKRAIITNFLKKFSLNNRSVKFNFITVFFIAFLAALVFFIPNMVSNKGIFLLKADYIQEQIPFYIEAKRVILSGTPFWSWNTELGTNFIGSYTFYLLGSPFFWLTLPFPESTIPYLLGWILILKIGLTAGFAFIYLRLFVQNAKFAAIGAFLYAFGSNILVALPFNHFQESFLIFPLVLYALEKAMTENRYKLFSIIIFVSLTMNYYHFIGQTVFIIIYIIIRILSKEWGGSNLKKLPKLIFAYICGVLCSAVIVVPTFYTVISSTRAVSQIHSVHDALVFPSIFSPSMFHYTEMIYSFFLPSVASDNTNLINQGWFSNAFALPVFGMVGVIAFWLNKDNRKTWISKLLIVCIIMSFIPILNLLFTALRGLSFYERWWYMPSLIAALATVRALETANIKHKIKAFVINILICIVLFILPFCYLKYKGMYDSVIHDEKYMKLYFFTVLCSVIGTLMLIPSLGIFKLKKVSVGTIAIICLIVYIGFAGNFYIFMHNNYVNPQEPDSSKDGSFYTNLIAGKDKVKAPQDDEFSRIDYSFELNNMPMYINKPGINGFHSLMNPSSLEFGAVFGYHNLNNPFDVKTIVPPNQTALRSLLSVKWFINTDMTNSYLSYSWLKLTNEYKNYQVYKNELYIPFGFTYDKYCNIDDLAIKDSNIMLKAVVLNSKQIQQNTDILRPLDMSSLDTSYEVLVKDVSDRKKETCSDFKATAAGFDTKINLSETRLVFFSVPYDKSWKATVNGKSTAIEKVNIGFMAVRVPKGENKIVFKYEPTGLKLGIIISSIGILLQIIIFTKFFIGKKSKK